MSETSVPLQLRFNPSPRIEVVGLGAGLICQVIDDALLDPEACVQHANQRRDAFVEAPHNAYPGRELALDAEQLEPMDRFFSAHSRRAMGGRRTLRMHARLSLVTRAPEELQPLQRICHVDRLQQQPGQCIAACVLYLFADAELGGTGFYRPRRPFSELAPLLRDAAVQSNADFNARHGVAPGYMTASNDWFEKVASVPARWNRLIVYPGMVFHSGDITAPQRLSTDPAKGRLTLNGFFTCQADTVQVSRLPRPSR